MRNCFLVLGLIATIDFTTLPAWGHTKLNVPSSSSQIITQEMKPFFNLSNGQIEDLLKGNVVAEGEVDSPSANEQKLELFVSGIHPRSCPRAMRKLSLYENYYQYMDFIKKSNYDEKSQRFSFVIDHTLLPFPMLVTFKIPRIHGEGHYPFTFEHGFLKNLKGTVIVKDLEKHCLMGLRTDWKGAKSKIPDSLFGTFIEVIGKVGLEHLMRVSLF
jgi:hypothetical protein